MLRTILSITIFLIAFAGFVFIADAQCPMCKMAAESNLKDGGAAGTGLNTGILYLLSMPYLMVLTLALLWRRNKRLSAKEEIKKAG